MRNLRRFILPVIAVWIVAGGLVLWSRSERATPESVAAYINKHPLEGQPDTKRQEIIAQVADQLNRLNFDQRQDLRKTKIDRRLFDQMTAEERGRFLDLTLPEGFKQLMIALNKMDPDKRKKIVQRALDDLQKENPDAEKRLDGDQAKKLMSQGLTSFYENASADVKMDFAPVLEQLQHVTQGMR